MINDVVDLKNKNTKLVLDLLRFSPGLTKKDIAEKSGLSITTVSTICNELKATGIVREERITNSRVGRIPSRITLRYRSFLVIGIDLQIDDIMGLSIINLHNEAIYMNTFDISSFTSVEEIAQLAKAQVDAFIAANGYADACIIGLGVSVPAIFDAIDERLISSSVPMYDGVNLKSIFRGVFNLPVYVDNSSNFKAISAHTSSKFENIVCLDISQGTGVGIICNGHLLRGENGYGAEIAHIPIGDMSLRCASCGAYGCVEAELRLPHLLEFYPHYQKDRPPQEQWFAFVEYIKEHPEDFQPFLRRVGSLIGHLTSILVNLFDPSLYMVTGYIADIYDIFYPYFIECVRQRCALSLARGLEFQVERYHSDSIYKGICDTIYSDWLPLDRGELCPPSLVE